MKNSTQRNIGKQSGVSQQKQLSFYEENYILEPEDYEKDNGYFQYESESDVLYFEESYKRAM